MVSRISSTTHGPQMATAGKERLQARNRMERVGARWTPLRICRRAVIPRRLKGRQVRPPKAGGHRGIGSSKAGRCLGLLLTLSAEPGLLQPAMSQAAGSWQLGPGLTTAREGSGSVTAPCPSNVPPTPSTLDCMYLIGGGDTSENPLASVQYYDPSSGGPWQTLESSLNQARSQLAAVTAPCPASSPPVPSTHVCIYAVGGEATSTSQLGSVEYYDPSSGVDGSWETLGTLLHVPQAFIGGAAAPCPSVSPPISSTDTCVYAIGGEAQTFLGFAILNSVEYYDPNTGTSGSWQVLGSTLPGVGQVELAASTAPAPPPALLHPQPTRASTLPAGSQQTAAVTFSFTSPVSTTTTQLRGRPECGEALPI